MEVSAQLVKELREQTGAGFMDCKKALAECSGDYEKAIDFLRKKGLAAAAKKAGRIASEGAVLSYIHQGGRIGVLLEVNCETDFVARGDDFQNFAKDIAMHIAAMNPRYLKREEVPENVLQREKEIFKQQAIESGKPETIAEKMVGGKVEKFFKESCLIEQPFVKDADKTVLQLETEITAKTGEKIAIRRFTRYELGEGLQKKSTDFASEVAEVLKSV